MIKKGNMPKFDYTVLDNTATVDTDSPEFIALLGWVHESVSRAGQHGTARRLHARVAQAARMDCIQWRAGTPRLVCGPGEKQREGAIHSMIEVIYGCV